jgi:hypothetical protein
MANDTSLNDTMFNLENQTLRLVLKQDPNTTRKRNLHFPQYTITKIHGIQSLFTEFRKYMAVVSDKTANYGRYAFAYVYSKEGKIATIFTYPNASCEGGYNVIITTPGGTKLTSEHDIATAKTDAHKAKVALSNLARPHDVAYYTVWKDMILIIKNYIECECSYAKPVAWDVLITNIDNQLSSVSKDEILEQLQLLSFKVHFTYKERTSFYGVVSLEVAFNRYHNTNIEVSIDSSASGLDSTTLHLHAACYNEASKFLNDNTALFKETCKQLAAHAKGREDIFRAGRM